MAEAYIYDAVRTPRGRGKKDGSLHEITALSLAAQALQEIRDRNGLDTALVDDVILGCVTPVGELGANIGRTAVLAADYAQTTAGAQVHRFCASGLEACNMAASKVMTGEAQMAVGGGVESMAGVPMGSDGGAWPIDPSAAFKTYFTPQGVSADLIATLHGFSRDDVDQYAVESQQRAATAWKEGRFARSVLPVKDQLGLTILDRDEHMRPETTMQSLASLNPSFLAMGEMGFDAVSMQRYPEIERIDHVHHAGNSSGIVDGAAAVLFGSKEAGEAAGLKPRARVRAMASIGSEPSIMLTGPVDMTEKILARAGMKIGDIDLFELNEAFASVVLRFMQAFDVPRDQINVNGGAIAMGHPLGAAGAMILGTVLDELERTDKQTALVTLCIGAGMGTATIIERVWTMSMETFRIEVDADGIALVTFDVPGRSMNTITLKVMAELPELVEHIAGDAAIKGVVLTSGKDTGFCAGADLDEVLGALAGQPSGEAGLKAGYDTVYGLTKAFRGLETCGKPVAAAINGLALGGGFEMTLACHYRVAADNSKIQLGLPEAKVGLMPGAGGTQRVPRMIGVMAAAPLVLEGKTLRPKEALAQGLINEVVPKGGEVEAAKAWIKAKGDPVQPWDKKEFKLPGGGPYHPQGAQVFIMGNAMLRKQSFGNYPAQLNIMKAVYEGLQVPMDAAIRIEARYFAATIATPEARAMVRTLFVSMQALGKGAARPAGAPKSEAKKVSVLGAGMMGAGIAYVQAMAGIETVLIDTAQEAAEKGKAYSKGLLDKRVSRGQMTAEKAEGVLGLITPTTNYAAVEGSDLVIEAVFENRETKAEVTKKAEAKLADTAVFGSNTSTLPITSLAQASARPANFIGVHFFSPVDKMMLVEIIRGKETSDETVAKAIDYVTKIRKTPIVVNNSRGFYTSRCFMTFLQEGIEMLVEGIAPAIIDNVGRMTGMPRGPLEMTDDVALDLAHKIVTQTAKDLGEAYKPGKLDKILEKLVVDLGRYGRKNGKGFYDYPEKGPKRLWTGLSELAPVKVARSDAALIERIRTRLLYRQAVEAARCFEEGVVTDPRDADVGAILGWGFAPWTGGPLSMIDRVGAAEFVETCDRLAADHGPRFAPPRLLREMAENGASFYGEAAARAA